MSNTTMVLATATGSICTRWYDAYRFVNNGTATDLYFRDDPQPAPRWIVSPGRGHQGLIYDPWTLVSREVAPYDPDAVVLVSAEQAWLGGR